MMKGKLASTE